MALRRGPEALFEPGEMISGKYRVDRVLGVGGMSAVFSAVHVGLDQRVAIKVMLPELLGNLKSIERFLREAKAAAKITGDHVGRVLDVGTTDDGMPFMALELLDGVDLGAYLEKRGTLPINEAVDLVLQACDGVARAHSVGIVHRDLKPSNLFLTSKDGRPCVKVIDFGISKLTDEKSQSLTQTSEVFGSPQYMSPEQITASRDVDARADIWALGCVLHELISGRPPFDAPSLMLLGTVICHEAPRPLTANRPDTPRELEAVVLRCLEKKREQRYASVIELASSLEAFGGAAGAALVESMRRVGVANPMPVSRASDPNVSNSLIDAFDRTQRDEVRSSPHGAAVPVGAVTKGTFSTHAPVATSRVPTWAIVGLSSLLLFVLAGTTAFVVYRVSARDASVTPAEIPATTLTPTETSSSSSSSPSIQPEPTTSSVTPTTATTATMKIAPAVAAVSAKPRATASSTQPTTTTATSATTMKPSPPPTSALSSAVRDRHGGD